MNENGLVVDIAFPAEMIISDIIVRNKRNNFLGVKK